MPLRVYESQGDLQAAMTYYQKALQVDPNDYQTLLSCGRLHDRQGDLPDKPRLTTSVRSPRSQVIPRPGTTWECATLETGIPNRR